MDWSGAHFFVPLAFNSCIRYFEKKATRATSKKFKRVRLPKYIQNHKNIDIYATDLWSSGVTLPVGAPPLSDKTLPP